MKDLLIGRARRSVAAVLVTGLALGAAAAKPERGAAASWSLGEAAAPYKGMTINVVVLDRPSYVAEKQLIPQ